MAVEARPQGDSQAALERVHAQLLAINRIISLTSATLDSKRIYQIACDELITLFAVSQVTAWEVDETSQTVSVVAQHDSAREAGAAHSNLRVHSAALIDDLRRRRTLTIYPDVRQAPQTAELRLHPALASTSTLIMLPLFVGQHLHGLLGLHGYAGRALGDDDMRMATSVQQAVAQALDNSQKHQQATASSRALQLQVSARTADLQRLNDRMAAVLHTIQEGILLVNTNGLIDNTNPAFNRMFDYAPDALFEQPFFTLAGPKEVPHLRVAFEHVVRTGERRNLQIQGQRSDGTQFDADVTMSRINRMEKYVLLTIRDITRYKTVERLKDQFISTVSHELRTPTTSIVLSANSLRQHYPRMNEMQRSAAIERIATQAQVLADMVEGILDISRIESRMTQRGETACDLGKIVRQVADEFLPDLTRKGQRLQLDIEPIDYEQIGTVLDYSRIWRNLISNAVKYSPEAATIGVRLGSLQINERNERHWSPLLHPEVIETPDDLPAGLYFVSQVEDRGRGIPEAEQAQLFSRFFRGWASQSNIPGTGLGLALVKELLHLYEGDISVHSIVNQGSTFSFWLPARGAAIS